MSNTYGKIVAGVIIGASMLVGAASAETAEPKKEVAYEFSFEYDRAELRDPASERAMRSRLKKSADRYCRRAVRAADAPKAKRTCRQAVVKDVNRRLRSSDRYASNQTD